MNKRITTLSIKGLNTSMPDLTVPDGACEVLNNLRFRDGSWQNVGAIQEVANIPLPEDVVYRGSHFEFLGVHEVEGVNHYIGKGVVESEDDAGYIYDDLYLFAYANGAWSRLGDAVVSIYATATSAAEALATDIRVTPFGNVLIVQCESKMSHFIWSDGSYRLFTMPRPVSIEEKIISSTPLKCDLTKGYMRAWNLMDTDTKDILHPANDGNSDEWWGEICYLVAYRMKDGSILSPSNLRISCSEGADNSEYPPLIIGRGIMGTDEFYSALMVGGSLNNTTLPDTTKRLRTFKPAITITIPEGVDDKLIDRVAVYSTRVNNIYDFDKIASLAYINSLEDLTDINSLQKVYASAFYADNKLPEQPFYLIKEIALEAFSGNRTCEVELGYDMFKNITTSSQIYEPTQVHTIRAEAIYDYNNRLHYGNMTSKLFKHLPNMEIVRGSEVNSAKELVERVSLKDVNAVAYSFPMAIVNQADSTKVRTPAIISYPDYRAESIEIAAIWDENTKAYGTNPAWKIGLKPAMANNFAYHIFPSSVSLKYPTTLISKDDSLDYSPSIATTTSTFSEPNRIQVSAPNNPFSLPFQNSYAVGNEGSRVVAMNTVADSLVDSNFYGNYPLYIFTSDGIFALRAGSGEVLYADTEIINHDRLVNPNTIALNGSVVYACEEGLKALAGRQAVRISADIDTKDGEWLNWEKAQFGVNWRFGELLCKIGADSYIYNVGAGVWSSRNDVEGSLVGRYTGVALTTGRLSICDITEEDMEETEITLITRPLKFESLGFKMIDTMIARLDSTMPSDWMIKVEESNDCKRWRVVKNVEASLNFSNVGLRRLTQSAKFFRITLSGMVRSITTISQIDIHLQDRYNNKLR